MQAIRISEEGVIFWLDFEEEDNTLDFLQGEVGGLIQYLPFPVDGVDAWINEEGKIIGQEKNPLATIAMRSGGLLFDGDYISGPMVLTSSNEEGETIGLTDEQTSQIVALLGGGA